MPKSIVIHGPAGCGKSRNAESLRKAYGMRSIHDSSSAANSEPVPTNNAVILTADTDGWSEFRCIPYSTAIAKAKKLGLPIITNPQTTESAT